MRPLMKRSFVWIVTITLLMASCKVPTPAPPTETAPARMTASPTARLEAVPTFTQTPPPAASPTPAARKTPALPAGEALAPFPEGDLGLPDTVQLKTWQPADGFAGIEAALPFNLAQAANPAVVSGLTPEQRALLAQNGFVVIQSQEAQFNDIREQVPIRQGQPYYLTSDAAYHALHITFNEMLKAAEAQFLRRQMREIVQAALDEVMKELPQAQGTSIEEDMLLAADTLAVALKLFDPQVQLDPAQEQRIAPQLAQIETGGGKAPSVLIPNFEDDYGAYLPVGHYAGQPALEAYFRGMTWLGRVHFLLRNDQPDFKPSRAPLIITLALRRAQVEGRSAAEAWAEIHALLTFLIGPSDDPGPAEYAALMDQVYTPGATWSSLADEGLWQQFLEASQQLPPPRINSTFVNTFKELETDTGWRFMGQRFTLDGFILQNLVFDKVGTREKARWLPSGLDVMAAFGSPEALVALEQSGATAYAHYNDQMSLLQQAVQAQPEAEWLGSFYSTWLSAFFPQFEPNRSPFPAYMQTSAWGYKSLNSTLGSWAELKHDTVLYAKMPEAMGGGGPPTSGPAPAYIEPVPNTFYRLAYAAQVIGTYFDLKLNWFGMEVDEPLPGDYLRNGLYDYTGGMLSLAERFNTLGDLAAKELSGEQLSVADYDLIQDCLGPIECLVFQSHTPYLEGEDIELPPVPVVAAVAGAQDELLEAAVGQVDRIYVLAPLEGGIQIAQGGVFSYFEFSQPRDDRLTDEAWRERLAAGNVRRPAWTASFSLSGGNSTVVLAFRVGDVYIITEEGDRLNVRAGPGTGEKVVRQLMVGDYVEIVDGPVSANGYTWWKLKLWEEEIGWAVENQDWYVRSTILKGE